MGTVITRRCLNAFLLVASPIFGCQAAPGMLAPDPLELQAQAEFAKVSDALRERFKKEAQGDFLGAGIAARAAEAHRYRFLDLKREIDNRRPKPATADPSVAEDRNPFMPDSFFSSPAKKERSLTPARRAATATSDPVRTWDMYRSRALPIPPVSRERDEAPAGQASVPDSRKDMYANASLSAAMPAPSSITADPVAETPRLPFLVYRESAPAVDRIER